MAYSEVNIGCGEQTEYAEYGRCERPFQRDRHAVEMVGFFEKRRIRRGRNIAEKAFRSGLGADQRLQTAGQAGDFAGSHVLVENAL